MLVDLQKLFGRKTTMSQVQSALMPTKFFTNSAEFTPYGSADLQDRPFGPIKF